MQSTENPGIRPFAPSDVEGFRELVTTTHEEFGFSYDPELDSDLESPQEAYDAIWVLSDGDTVLGSVALKRDGDTAELKRMYLQPELRGQGFGRELLCVAMEYAKKAGVKKLVLDTAGHQESAQRLYESAGFQKVRERTSESGKWTTIYYSLMSFL